MSRLAACSLAILVTACLSQGGAPTAEPRRAAGQRAAAEERVRAARSKLADHPRLDPVWAELGEALLDCARIAREPGLVAEAHAALERSLSIQPNFLAWRGHVALANFRHRFAEALVWAALAEAAYPEDTTVLAMRIEALVSLGRTDEAERWFEDHPPGADDFHARTAHARTACAAGRTEAGTAEYVDAAGRIRARAPALAQWALIRAAAARIDGGQPARARPLLEEARGLGPSSIDLEVHTSEVDEAEGRLAEALARCEALLERDDDPTVHAAAARLARALGDLEAAERHFGSAEQAFRAALAAGESYTLGALARLYADEGERLDEAEALAEHNREVVRLPESEALLERIRALRRRALQAAGDRPSE